MIKHMLWYSACRIPSYFLKLPVFTTAFIYRNMNTERVSKAGTNLIYSAKCSYHFSAIAKKNLWNKIKTVSEAVNMIEAKTCYSDCCCCLQRWNRMWFQRFSWLLLCMFLRENVYLRIVLGFWWFFCCLVVFFFPQNLLLYLFMLCRDNSRTTNTRPISPLC